MKFLKYLDIRQFAKTNRYYFIFNIVIGLCALLFFVVTRDTPMQQNLINVLFDQDIYLRSGMGELGRECDAKIAAKDIVVLSFDDESIKDFGRPNITPRNKIADLIRFAYEGGASVIVLDMALSEPDNSASVLLSGDSVPMTGKERDQELFKLLDKIKNDDTSVTKILLATDIHNDMTVKEGEFAALIDNKKIYAAVPKVSESLINDRRVRFWLPYMETIKGDEKKILWSFSLLTLALIEGGEDEFSRLSEEILNSDKENFVMHCKSGRDFIFHREINLGNGVMRGMQSLQYNRIQYVLTKTEWNNKLSIDRNLVGHWSGSDELSNPDIDFTDKIVIIGREDEECNDFVTTPIGTMSGMYVHANAIATILGKTQPYMSPLWKYILTEIILVIITAYVFVYLRHSGIKRVGFICTMTVICGVGSYIYFWSTNEFLYITFSFAGIEIYNFFISRMRKIFRKIHSLQDEFSKKIGRKSKRERADLDE